MSLREYKTINYYLNYNMKIYIDIYITYIIWSLNFYNYKVILNYSLVLIKNYLLIIIIMW